MPEESAGENPSLYVLFLASAVAFFLGIVVQIGYRRLSDPPVTTTKSDGFSEERAGILKRLAFLEEELHRLTKGGSIPGSAMSEENLSTPSFEALLETELSQSHYTIDRLSASPMQDETRLSQSCSADLFENVAHPERAQAQLAEVSNQDFDNLITSLPESGFHQHIRDHPEVSLEEPNFSLEADPANGDDEFELEYLKSSSIENQEGSKKPRKDLAATFGGENFANIDPEQGDFTKSSSFFSFPQRKKKHRLKKAPRKISETLCPPRPQGLSFSFLKKNEGFASPTKFEDDDFDVESDRYTKTFAGVGGGGGAIFSESLNTSFLKQRLEKARENNLGGMSLPEAEFRKKKIRRSRIKVNSRLYPKELSDSQRPKFAFLRKTKSYQEEEDWKQDRKPSLPLRDDSIDTPLPEFSRELQVTMDPLDSSGAGADSLSSYRSPLLSEDFTKGLFSDAGDQKRRLAVPVDQSCSTSVERPNSAKRKEIRERAEARLVKTSCSSESPHSSRSVSSGEKLPPITSLEFYHSKVDRLSISHTLDMLTQAKLLAEEKGSLDVGEGEDSIPSYDGDSFDPSSEEEEKALKKDILLDSTVSSVDYNTSSSKPRRDSSFLSTSFNLGDRFPENRDAPTPPEEISETILAEEVSVAAISAQDSGLTVELTKSFTDSMDSLRSPVPRLEGIGSWDSLDVQDSFKVDKDFQLNNESVKNDTGIINADINDSISLDSFAAQSYASSTDQLLVQKHFAIDGSLPTAIVHAHYDTDTIDNEKSHDPLISTAEEKVDNQESSLSSSSSSSPSSASSDDEAEGKNQVPNFYEQLSTADDTVSVTTFNTETGDNDMTDSPSREAILVNAGLSRSNSIRKRLENVVEIDTLTIETSGLISENQPAGTGLTLINEASSWPSEKNTAATILPLPQQSSPLSGITPLAEETITQPTFEPKEDEKPLLSFEEALSGIKPTEAPLLDEVEAGSLSGIPELSSIESFVSGKLNSSSGRTFHDGKDSWELFESFGKTATTATRLDQQHASPMDKEANKLDPWDQLMVPDNTSQPNKIRSLDGDLVKSTLEPNLSEPTSSKNTKATWWTNDLSLSLPERLEKKRDQFQKTFLTNVSDDDVTPFSRSADGRLPTSDPSVKEMLMIYEEADNLSRGAIFDAINQSNPQRVKPKPRRNSWLGVRKTNVLDNLPKRPVRKSKSQPLSEEVTISVSLHSPRQEESAEILLTEGLDDSSLMHPPSPTEEDASGDIVEEFSNISAIETGSSTESSPYHQAHKYQIKESWETFDKLPNAVESLEDESSTSSDSYEPQEGYATEPKKKLKTPGSSGPPRVPGNPALDKLYGMLAKVDSVPRGESTNSEEEILNVTVSEDGVPHITMQSKREMKDSGFPEISQDENNDEWREADENWTSVQDRPGIKVEARELESETTSEDFLAVSESEEDEDIQDAIFQLDARAEQIFDGKHIRKTNSLLWSNGDRLAKSYPPPPPNEDRPFRVAFSMPDLFLDNQQRRQSAPVALKPDDGYTSSSMEDLSDKRSRLFPANIDATGKKAVSWSDLSGRPLEIGPTSTTIHIEEPSSPKPIIKSRVVPPIPPRPKIIKQQVQMVDSGLGQTSSPTRVMRRTSATQTPEKTLPYTSPGLVPLKATYIPADESLLRELEQYSPRLRNNFSRSSRPASSSGSNWEPVTPSSTASFAQYQKYQVRKKLSDLKFLVKERDRVCETLEGAQGLSHAVSMSHISASPSTRSSCGRFENRVSSAKIDLDTRIREIWTQLTDSNCEGLLREDMQWILAAPSSDKLTLGRRNRFENSSLYGTPLLTKHILSSSQPNLAFTSPQSRELSDFAALDYHKKLAELRACLVDVYRDMETNFTESLSTLAIQKPKGFQRSSTPTNQTSSGVFSLESRGDFFRHKRTRTAKWIQDTSASSTRMPSPIVPSSFVDNSKLPQMTAANKTGEDQRVDAEIERLLTAYRNGKLTPNGVQP